MKNSLNPWNPYKWDFTVSAYIHNMTMFHALHVHNHKNPSRCTLALSSHFVPPPQLESVWPARNLRLDRNESWHLTPVGLLSMTSGKSMSAFLTPSDKSKPTFLTPSDKYKPAFLTIFSPLSTSTTERVADKRDYIAKVAPFTSCFWLCDCKLTKWPQGLNFTKLIQSVKLVV